jgi:hypothetical protein
LSVLSKKPEAGALCSRIFQIHHLSANVPKKASEFVRVAPQDAGDVSHRLLDRIFCVPAVGGLPMSFTRISRHRRVMLGILNATERRASRDVADQL